MANNPTTWTDPSGHALDAVQQFASPTVVAMAEACARLGWCAVFLGQGFRRILSGSLPAIGGAVIVLLTLVVCTLDDACRTMAQNFHDDITAYGSAATAGTWNLGAQATQTVWQNFPKLPQQVLCALGGLENMAVTAVQNAASWSRGSASDYSMAAAFGCATSGGGGGSSSSNAGQSTAGNRRLPFTDTDRLTEVNKTLDRIETGGPFPYAQDGSVFANKEGLLPAQPYGYYHEYTVDTPGSATRAQRRIVRGANGETYYTDTHYRSFIQIDPRRYP